MEFVLGGVEHRLQVLHDAFKAEVRPDERWSPENDHAIPARRFAGTPEHALAPLLEHLPDIELFAVSLSLTPRESLWRG